jgi:hypothetical protein
MREGRPEKVRLLSRDYLNHAVSEKLLTVLSFLQGAAQGNRARRSTSLLVICRSSVRHLSVSVLFITLCLAM